MKNWQRISMLLLSTIAFLTLAISGQVIQASGGDGGYLWVGQYYNNTTFSGNPVTTRVDYDVNFDWGNASPSAGIPADNFSVRWTNNISLTAGTYRFQVRADDQVRIFVDGREVINTFTTNVVDQLITGEITLAAGQHNIVIEYREYVGPAFIFFDYTDISNGVPDFVTTPEPAPIGQWVARYYPNPNLEGNPVAILGGQEPRGNWGNSAPLASLPDDEWSARWEATLLFNGDTYIFTAQADDGVRVYVDGRPIIDEWHTARATTYTTAQTFTAGLHNIVVEYYESGGTASLNFDYEISRNPVNPVSPTNPETPAYLGTVTIATGRLNVRDAPNPFTGQILTKVSRGETYRVLAFNASETWIQISANGYTGWVNSGYVAFNQPDTNPSQYTVTAAPYTVNIRSGPGTQFDDIGNFENGDTADVVGRNAGSTWWQINYNGIVGWVTARYANIESFADIDSIPITG